jgi:hypothetical protein
MPISFLSVHAYKKRNRVIVQYYSSGEEGRCLCPECGFKAELSTAHCSNEISCSEILCSACGTPLAMVSSKLPNDQLECRCI